MVDHEPPGGLYRGEVESISASLSVFGADSYSVSVDGSRNQVPVADAGVDWVASVSSPVLLDGSASYDPEGDELAFRWRLVAAPGDGEGTIEGVDTVKPRLVPAATGLYRVSLVVEDALSWSLADEVAVTVE